MPVFTIQKFPVTVTVTDTLEASRNKQAYLLGIVRATYGHKCYKGVFIVEVLSLASATAIRMVPTNSSLGTVDVVFEARTVRLAKDDLLPAVTLVDLPGTGMYIGQSTSPQAAVVFDTQAAPRTFGGRVPAVVAEVMHQPMEETPSVIVTVYRPAPVTRTWAVRGQPTRPPGQAILHEELRTELAWRAENEAEVRAVEDYVYGPRAGLSAARLELPDVGAWAGLTDGRNYVPIVGEAELEGGWSRPAELPGCAPAALRVEPAHGVPRLSADQFVDLVLRDSLKWMRFARELCQEYPGVKLELDTTGDAQ